MKAGVRFVSYDHFKHMLMDSEVRSFICYVHCILIIFAGKNDRATQSTRYNTE